MIVRLATQADLPEILDIYNHAILHTTAVYEYQPHTIEMREQWFKEKVRTDIPVFVAVVDGRAAGFASYGGFRAWAAYKYSVEHSVYVHEQFRRRGIAKVLLKQLLDSVKGKNIHTFIAGIDAENEISITLHKQLGFSEIGHFKQVGFKFGKWLDLKFYQLILEANFQPDEH